MSTQTLPRRWAPVTGSRRQNGRPTALVRLAALQSDAAALVRATFPRGRKCYGPTVTPKKLSQARHTGGGLADAAALMLANPAEAMRLASWLGAVARSVAADHDECLIAVLLEEQRADADEDISAAEVLAERTPETLRKYIEDADRAIATLKRARDAAARALEDME